MENDFFLFQFSSNSVIYMQNFTLFCVEYSVSILASCVSFFFVLFQMHRADYIAVNGSIAKPYECNRFNCKKKCSRCIKLSDET